VSFKAVEGTLHGHFEPAPHAEHKIIIGI